MEKIKSVWLDEDDYSIDTSAELSDANPVCQDFECPYLKGRACDYEYSSFYGKRCHKAVCAFHGSCIVCEKNEKCGNRIKFSTRLKTGAAAS